MDLLCVGKEMCEVRSRDSNAPVRNDGLSSFAMKQVIAQTIEVCIADDAHASSRQSLPLLIERGSLTLCHDLEVLQRKVDQIGRISILIRD